MTTLAAENAKRRSFAAATPERDFHPRRKIFSLTTKIFFALGSAAPRVCDVAFRSTFSPARRTSDGANSGARSRKRYVWKTLKATESATFGERRAHPR
jgi:hypothetical protein